MLAKRTKHRDNDQRKTTLVDLSIGMALAAQRKHKGLSQTELGEQVGVTFQQIQKYECGMNRLSVTRFVAIAGVLWSSVTPGFILDAILRGEGQQ